LREKLLVIKTACEEYDENTAEKALQELDNTTWSPSTKELLSAISKHLLHSDFDEIVDVVNQFMDSAR